MAKLPTAPGVYLAGQENLSTLSPPLSVHNFRSETFIPVLSFSEGFDRNETGV